MAGSNRVAIEIYVDDQGSVHVREFADKTSQALGDVEQKSQSVTQRIQQGWGAVKAAWAEIFAGVMAIREAWDLANLAAKAEQEKVAFANLAASYGKNAKQMIAALKEASGQTIDTMTLIRSAGTAMMMDIDPDTIVRLMGIARATAKQTGQTVTKAFEDISLAVGRQSRMILDNLGIIVEVEKANEDYAASLGKTAGELTDAEKKQAFLNATIKGGEALMDKLGTQTNTNADRLQRFTAKIEDIKVAVGSGLVRAFNVMSAIFDSTAAAALATAGGIFKVAEGVGWLTDKLHLTKQAAAAWKMQADAAFEGAWSLVDRANQSFKDAAASTDIMAQGMANHRQQVEETTTATNGLAEADQALLDKLLPLEAKKREIAEQEAQLKTLYEGGKITLEQYNLALANLHTTTAQYKQALSETEERVRSFTAAVEMSSMFLGADVIASEMATEGMYGYKTALQLALEGTEQMDGTVEELAASQALLAGSLDGTADSYLNLASAAGIADAAMKSMTQAGPGSGGGGGGGATYTGGGTPLSSTGFQVDPRAWGGMTNRDWQPDRDEEESKVSITNNFNQAISRNDAVSISEEQARRLART